jgi:hypothetical protein
MPDSEPDRSKIFNALLRSDQSVIYYVHPSDAFFHRMRIFENLVILHRLVTSVCCDSCCRPMLCLIASPFPL